MGNKDLDNFDNINNSDNLVNIAESIINIDVPKSSNDKASNRGKFRFNDSVYIQFKNYKLNVYFCDLVHILIWIK